MKIKHIIAIDGIRAIAALSVFLQHILQQFSSEKFPINFGWAGVTLFFLLSGFCIHYTQAQTRQMGCSDLDIRYFWKRRLFRIFPVYFASLLISLCLGQYQQSNLVGQYHGSFDFWMHFFFVHNLNPMTFYSINAVFWTIAIEMQFYLIYTLFYRYFKFSLKECALFFCIGLVWYAIISVALVEPWRGVLQRSFVSTFWIWHLGATMATIFISKEGSIDKTNYGLLVVLTFIVLIWDPVVFRLHIVYWVGPLLFAVFIWKSLAFNTPSGLNYIGKVSYSLYLLHPVAIVLVMFWGGEYPQYWVVPLALMLAVVGYYSLERPFISFNKRRLKI